MEQSEIDKQIKIHVIEAVDKLKELYVAMTVQPSRGEWWNSITDQISRMTKNLQRFKEDLDKPLK
jgi:hypothetical protein